VCIIVPKTTSKLECAILTTLYLANAKTLIVGAPGRGVCNVLFLWRFQWFPHLCSPSPLMVNI
jgi:hypothetical protein